MTKTDTRIVYYLIRVLHILTDEIFSSVYILPSNGPREELALPQGDSVLDLTGAYVVLTGDDGKFVSEVGSICYVRANDNGDFVVDAVNTLVKDVTLPFDLIGPKYHIGEEFNPVEDGGHTMYRFGKPSEISKNMPDALELLAESDIVGTIRFNVVNIIDSSHKFGDAA